jgi:hypothetical protein
LFAIEATERRISIPNSISYCCTAGWFLEIKRPLKYIPQKDIPSQRR